MDTTTKEGKYIYCIIEVSEANPTIRDQGFLNDGAKTFGPLGIGGRGDELYTICHNGIAAVVSNSPIVKYQTSRENLLAHEKAIEEVMEKYTVLPVRFATITESEGKVKKILEKKYDDLKELLSKMKGKKELGVKAIFKEDIYNDIVEKNEDIMRLKEAIASQPPQATYYQRIEVGKMVESALEKEKERCKEDILNTLSPLAQEVKINNAFGERMIINAAFLVSVDNEAEFDKEIHELDARHEDKIKFKYIGKIPPFNFVNLSIKTEEL